MAQTDIFLALSTDGFKIGGAAQKTKDQEYGSSDIRCPGAIEVLSYEHTVKQHGKQSGGRPRSVERVEHQEFVITKAVDAFSPLLFRMCCGADYVTEAKVLLFSAGGWTDQTCPAPFLIYTMTYVHIDEVSPSGGSGIPTEKIALKYGQMKITHSKTEIERDWSQVLEAPVKLIAGGSNAGNPSTTRP